MKKQVVLTAIKAGIILLLVLAIGSVATLHWKKDRILEKSLALLQEELADTLQYGKASLDWLGHFPFVAIQIEGLKIGSGASLFIDSAHLDLVIRPFPLLRNEIILNHLHLAKAKIHIVRRKDRWSYEVFAASGAREDSRVNTSIHKLRLSDCTVHYDDGRSMSFTLHIDEAESRGHMAPETVRFGFTSTVALRELVYGDYSLPAPVETVLSGEYAFDLKTGRQEFHNWTLSYPAVQVSLDGAIQRKPGQTATGITIQWKKGDMEKLLPLAPARYTRLLEGFNLAGETQGEITIKGRVSNQESPGILLTATLKNGSIRHNEMTEPLRNLNLEVRYDNTGTSESPGLALGFTSSSGRNPLKGELTIDGHKAPGIRGHIAGSLPAGLLNMAGIPSLRIKSGMMDMERFRLEAVALKSFSLASALEKGDIAFTTGDLVLIYNGSPIEIKNARFSSTRGATEIALDQLVWDKATALDVTGRFSTESTRTGFDLKGKLCGGNVTTAGHLLSSETRPVLSCIWQAKDIDMQDLLASFSNFNQDFITSNHLSGKADISAETVIPFDRKWKIRSKEISARSAIHIRDGRLKNLKTLEDFSAYVHLQDLKDIRFSQLRNYLKIENGQVYLPVMFIQSSALNLSISGVHAFDQKIQYFVKLNAGQAAAQKLKKSDMLKDLKPARKSGWINMYFVLEGTTSNVSYRQYRTAVISGFEQSARLKESLRHELVDMFGYDVYWLEPNEWEDIPEFK